MGLLFSLALLLWLSLLAPPPFPLSLALLPILLPALSLALLPLFALLLAPLRFFLVLLPFPLLPPPSSVAPLGIVALPSALLVPLPLLLLSALLFTLLDLPCLPVLLLFPPLKLLSQVLSLPLSLYQTISFSPSQTLPLPPLASPSLQPQQKP